MLALQELAKFFSLPFNKLSIFDAFPFITENEFDQKDVDHSESHTTFDKMILEKWLESSVWNYFRFLLYDKHDKRKRLEIRRILKNRLS